MYTDTHYSLLLTLFQLTNVFFAFAFGACVGSLTNVLVYRIPLGLGVVTPPSRCPSCETRLTWRENIPVIGWILLGGKCRFCRSRVSIEYPLVEAAVGVLFAAIYLKLYSEGPFLGIPFERLEPAWAWAGFSLTWPILIGVLTLVSCLTAATLIDARTFQIPLVFTWIPAGTAVVAHMLAYVLGERSQYSGLGRFARGWDWVIATPGPHGWAWVGASLGGIAGLGVALALLRTGLVKRSFFDYDDWLRSTQATQGTAPFSAELTETSPTQLESAVEPPQSEAQMWLAYPHARREMLRELIFLAPCIGLALAGAALAIRFAAPWLYDTVKFENMPATTVPGWLNVLCGVLMGYLIAGGVVWAARILGTFAVGREALGLGDVHLMAAVGAMLGWTVGVLGFFAAAFVGVFWTLLAKLFTGTLQRQMPFGPYLAIGTLLVWYFQPGLERLLGIIFRIDGPFLLP